MFTNFFEIPYVGTSTTTTDDGRTHADPLRATLALRARASRSVRALAQATTSDGAGDRDRDGDRGRGRERRDARCAPPALRPCTPASSRARVRRRIHGGTATARERAHETTAISEDAALPRISQRAHEER